LLGFCTPKDKIDGTVCASEASCPADQGCVRYGGRTSLLVCRKVGGTKSLGAACAGPAECRSGECYDREFKLPATGKRTFCSGVCAKNSDCAADQRCVPSVLANNNTPADPFDDVVVGYCQTLFTPTAAGGCANDGACGGTQGDTCDVTHGLCYKKGTPIGAACANPNGSDNTGCDLGAVCVSGNGGYCQSTGCVAGAAAGVDACPGTTSVCSQRFADKPLGACYEKCATASDCSRFNQSYRCKAPTGDPGVPASICLFDTGV
jgi:hypothetical protein